MSRKRVLFVALVPLFRGLAVGASVLALALPWMRDVWGWEALSFIDAAFGYQCHRLPGRVAWLGGVPMAVCSRCAGIYVGIGLGAAMVRPRISARHTTYLVAAAGALMLGEVMLEGAGWWPIVHPVRFVTGAAFSWPVSVLVVRWLRAKRREAERNRSRSRGSHVSGRSSALS